MSFAIPKSVLFEVSKILFIHTRVLCPCGLVVWVFCVCFFEGRWLIFNVVCFAQCKHTIEICDAYSNKRNGLDEWRKECERKKQSAKKERHQARNRVRKRARMEKGEKKIDSGNKRSKHRTAQTNETKLIYNKKSAHLIMI